MPTVNITAENFETTVEQGIVLIDFWASWCGPCRRFAPIFEAAAARHSDVVFGKVDTQAEPDLSGALHIRAIPTLMVFRDGVLLASQSGVLPAAALDELVRNVRALDMDKLRTELAEEERKQAAAAAADA